MELNLELSRTNPDSERVEDLNQERHRPNHSACRKMSYISVWKLRCKMIAMNLFEEF